MSNGLWQLYWPSLGWLFSTVVSVAVQLVLLITDLLSPSYVMI